MATNKTVTNKPKSLLNSQSTIMNIVAEARRQAHRVVVIATIITITTTIMNLMEGEG